MNLYQFCAKNTPPPQLVIIYIGLYRENNFDKKLIVWNHHTLSLDI